MIFRLSTVLVFPFIRNVRMRPFHGAANPPPHNQQDCTTNTHRTGCCILCFHVLILAGRTRAFDSSVFAEHRRRHRQTPHPKSVQDFRIKLRQTEILSMSRFCVRYADVSEWASVCVCVCNPNKFRCVLIGRAVSVACQILCTHPHTHKHKHALCLFTYIYPRHESERVFRFEPER